MRRTSSSHHYLAAFSSSYEQARELLLHAATLADCHIESWRLNERGPVGETLAIDVARWGSPDAQRMLHELFTPQPGAYFVDALDVPNVAELGISCRYILSEDDRALFLSGAELAGRIGLEPIMVPGAHQSLLTHPDHVADAILGRPAV